MTGDDKIQSEGRRENAALPLNESDNTGGPERYPAVRSDDAVDGEGRSFERPNNPQPRQGAGDTTTPTSSSEGRLGPGADPAEGKR